MCAAMTQMFGEFEFDETRRRLTRGGRPVQITGQALDLLWMLVKRPGELLSREEIKGFLWPDSSQDLEHSLDVVVNRLRRILGDSGKAPQYIETVPRRGFRFLTVVSDSSTTDSAPHQDFVSFRGQKVRPVLRAFRWVALFGAIVLIAALGGILFAGTRYERFVPPQRPAGGTLTTTTIDSHFLPNKLAGHQSQGHAGWLLRFA
jgi:DNA-binding winged helix-turn-helix (wHTH) protein